MKYELLKKGQHEIFKTVNLNSFGKFDQHDDLYQTLKVMRPDLSDRDILGVITEERIKRHVMDIDTTMIRKIIKKYLPEYTSVSVNKKQNIKEVMDMFDTGKVVIRMGTQLVVYDADTGSIYTGLRELYTIRPVTEIWTKEN